MSSRDAHPRVVGYGVRRTNAYAKLAQIMGAVSWRCQAAWGFVFAGVVVRWVAGTTSRSMAALERLSGALWARRSRGGVMQEDSERHDAFVQSLARGLEVIRAFGAERPEMTLSEVAKVTGMSRASARRFLLTLVELDYARTDGRAFALTPRVLELGYAYLSGLTLAEVAQPHIEDLVARVHESSSVAVLDRTDIVYVVRVPTKRIMTVNISVGTRFPAYATSMGRVLLAGLGPTEVDRLLARSDIAALTPLTVTDPDQLRRIIDEVRARGYAITDQELEGGLRSLAVPIRDRQGKVIAAINVSAQAPRVSIFQLEQEFLSPLLDAAARIRADLPK